MKKALQATMVCLLVAISLKTHNQPYNRAQLDHHAVPLPLAMFMLLSFSIHLPRRHKQFFNLELIASGASQFDCREEYSL